MDTLGVAPSLVDCRDHGHLDFDLCQRAANFIDNQISQACRISVHKERRLRFTAPNVSALDVEKTSLKSNLSVIRRVEVHGTNVKHLLSLQFWQRGEFGKPRARDKHKPLLIDRDDNIVQIDIGNLMIAAKK